MAQNKKSVLLYCDIIHTVSKLSDVDAGLLFKHYLAYINDLNPEAPNQLIDIVFEPIKQNLKRDLKKWEEEIDKKSESGLVGNLKRWNKDVYEMFMRGEIDLKEALEIARGRKTSQSDKNIANIAVKDKVTVKVKDKDNVKDKVREYVTLTQIEFNKLISEHGEEATNWMLDKLNAYKLSNGKKYKSDYGAILNWVVKSYKEHKEKNKDESNPLINAINQMYKQ